MPKQRALSPEKHDAVSHSASGITNNVGEAFESVDGHMTRGANVPSATGMWAQPFTRVWNHDEHSSFEQT